MVTPVNTAASPGTGANGPRVTVADIVDPSSVYTVSVSERMYHVPAAHENRPVVRIAVRQALKDGRSRPSDRYILLRPEPGLTFPNASHVHIHVGAGRHPIHGRHEDMEIQKIRVIDKGHLCSRGIQAREALVDLPLAYRFRRTIELPCRANLEDAARGDEP